MTALVALVTSGMLAPVALADVSNFADFSDGRQLSDGELDQLRGRFVDKGQILYFGVKMSSEWRTSAGEHLLAGNTLHGDLSGSVPTVTFEPHVSVSSPGTAAVAHAGNGGNGGNGNGTSISDAGISNARGVVQSIQAAGDFNAAANDLQIDVMDASQYPGRSASSGNGETYKSLLSGASVAVNYEAGRMDMALEVPDMGSVKQAIVPSHGLRQSIQLTSDFQQVHNLTRLQLYMGPQGTNASVPGVRRVMESARQLSR